MYNTFRKGTEAYMIMEGFIEADKTLVNAQDEFDGASREACDMIEHLEGELDDAETRESDLQKEVDELKEKYSTAQFNAERAVAFRYIHALEEAATVLVNAANSLRFDYETSPADSRTGDSGDGGPEAGDAAGAGETTSEGITRPQIP